MIECKSNPWKNIRHYDNIIVETSATSVRYTLPDLGQTFVWYAGKNPVRGKGLGLMAKFKADVSSYIEKKGIPPVKKCKIIGKNDNILSQFPVFRGAFEVDVVGAYWNTARIKGIISNETYEHGKKMKYERNAVIGMLATKRDVHTWDGETLNYQETISGMNINGERLPTEGLFWDIAKHVSDVMALHHNDSLFYWVDACFSPFQDFPEKMRRNCEGIFDVKTDVVDVFYSRSESKIIVTGKGKERPFFFSRASEAIFGDI